MTEPTYNATERRPIQCRNTRLAEVATQLLVKLGISPNTISLSGMVAALAAGLSFYFTDLTTGTAERTLWFFAGLMCQVRLLCNLFDGMVAVKIGTASPKGELYNEVPDRISDIAVFVCLGYSSGSHVALGYLAALASVFVAYVRAAAKSIGAPNDFCGPMAKPQRMALATALAVYMTFSPVSWRWTWGEAKTILLFVIVGSIVTAFRRLLRAAKHLEGPENDSC